jgi:hypothetical protein
MVRAVVPGQERRGPTVPTSVASGVSEELVVPDSECRSPARRSCTAAAAAAAGSGMVPALPTPMAQVVSVDLVVEARRRDSSELRRRQESMVSVAAVAAVVEPTALLLQLEPQEATASSSFVTPHPLRVYRSRIARVRSTSSNSRRPGLVHGLFRLVSVRSTFSPSVAVVAAAHGSVLAVVAVASPSRQEWL